MPVGQGGLGLGDAMATAWGVSRVSGLLVLLCHHCVCDTILRAGLLGVTGTAVAILVEQ